MIGNLKYYHGYYLWVTYIIFKQKVMKQKTLNVGKICHKGILIGGLGIESFLRIIISLSSGGLSCNI